MNEDPLAEVREIVDQLHELLNELRAKLDEIEGGHDG